MIVRASRTGAAGLATSLAQDLVNCPPSVPRCGPAETM